jgi:hypothetical protein
MNVIRLTPLQQEMLGQLGQYEAELVKLHEYSTRSERNNEQFNQLVNVAMRMITSIRQDIMVGEEGRLYYVHHLGCLSGFLNAALLVGHDYLLIERE